MAVSASLKRLCPHTVTIEPASGQDDYAKPTYGDAVEYSCLIEHKPRMVRRADSREVVSTTAIYLTDTPTLTLNDKVTLPDGRTPAILMIGTWADTKGDYFSVLYT